MTDSRIIKIYDTASKMFIQRGYSLTQIDHIVKEVGISVGSLYDLFSGKQAILKFILKCTINPVFTDNNTKLPITEDLFEHLHEEAIEFFDKNHNQFSKRLTWQTENYSFEQMLSDAFDMINKYRIGCLIIEKNPSVCGKLFDYYQEYRRKFYNSILEYIKIYIKQGTVRKVESPELVVMFIVESISWWAMDIKYNTFENRDDISDNAAKTVCLDALINAYITK